MSDVIEKYAGKVTPVGNSRGIRLDAAFFKAHPEFNGEVRATVLADGQLLISAARPAGRKAGTEEDPVLLGFLSFLERRMVQEPDQIVPADASQLARIARLVKGVETE